MIRSQKSQYDINREAAKTLTKFSYSHLGKAFEKQAKTIKDQEKKKQIKALKSMENS